jgi:alkaline phosphatase
MRSPFGAAGFVTGFLCVLAGLSASTACAAEPPPVAPVVAPRVDPRALPKPGAYALVGAGDIGECTDQPKRTANLVTQVLAASPNARAFTAGDNAYPNGTPEDFAACYAPAWGRFRDRTLAVAGNHDWRTANAAGFRRYFELAADAPTYRAVDVGSWRVLLLDSDCKEVGGCGPDSPQGRFVADELKAHPARCSVAIWHHARFASSGGHGPDDRTTPLWRVLDAAGVDVILQGHDHNYERFQPLTADGQPGGPASGITSFVVGTGGAHFHEPAHAALAGSQALLDGVAGVLVLHLEEDKAKAFFVDTAGQIRDEATIPCR